MSRVVVFTLGCTAALLAYGLVMDSPLTLLYTSVNLGLMGLLALLNRGIGWSLGALWQASFVGLGNMLGGVVLVEGRTLYLTDVIGPIGYDKIFHFAAAAGLSLLAWEAVEGIAGPGARRGITGLAMVVWLAVMGGGAVVEIAEFIGASIGDVNVGDYANNALDLVANGLGALLGVSLVANTRRDPARG